MNRHRILTLFAAASLATVASAAGGAQQLARPTCDLDLVPIHGQVRPDSPVQLSVDTSVPHGFVIIVVGTSLLQFEIQMVGFAGSVQIDHNGSGFFMMPVQLDAQGDFSTTFNPPAGSGQLFAQAVVFQQGAKPTILDAVGFGRDQGLFTGANGETNPFRYAWTWSGKVHPLDMVIHRAAIPTASKLQLDNGIGPSLTVPLAPVNQSLAFEEIKVTFKAGSGLKSILVTAW